MNFILAIDPGNDLGWASFHTQEGFMAGGVRNPPKVSTASGYDRAVIERPQVYRASQSKGDPNDLITLAIGVGQMKERLEAAGLAVELVLPTTWKGQTPKEIHSKRILAALSEEEVFRLNACLNSLAPSIRHNLVDAVGLGLWLLKRLRR
jgi:hypothetical protein